MQVSKNENIVKSRKKKAHFLKIRISSEKHNINLPPIPLVFTKAGLVIFIRLYNLFSKSEHQENIVQAFYFLRQSIDFLKYYPPFEIVRIQDKEHTIIIQTK